MKLLFFVVLLAISLANTSVVGQFINGTAFQEGIDLPFFSYHPDQNRTTCQMVRSRGFGCEIHPVTTKAGYIIELHRITVPGAGRAKDRFPVILQTGLIGTSADFVMGQSDEVYSDTSGKTGRNMGTELAKQGYDVWLSNNRGNEYALRHTHLDVDNDEFWNFTFQDISQDDTPSIIDYVLAMTNSKKLHFIGHSQGSAVIFALLSETTAYNEKLATFIAISPITRIGKALTSFRWLAKALALKYDLTLKKNGPVFTKNFLTNTLVPLACDIEPSRQICELVFFSIIGPDYTQLDTTRMGVYMSHQPSSTALKNIVHFNQLFSTDKFAKFDYGPIQNLAIYGKLIPPEYHLASISHPAVYVIYGRNDWFVPLSGVEALKKELKAKEYYEISNVKSNHMDALIGLEDAIEVNQKVASILEEN